MCHSAEMDAYMDNLDEFVEVENRIVTYKWLSRTLDVPVNFAKELLRIYAEKQRTKAHRPDLSILYMVIGNSVDENGMAVKSVKLVKDEHLDDVKSSLVEVSSVHIYSLQRSELTDMGVLYLADYDLQKEKIFESNKTSAIVCEKATRRNAEEICKLESFNNDQQKPDNGTICQQLPSTSAAAKKLPTAPVAKTTPQTSGVIGMFTKAAQKNKNLIERGVEPDKTGKEGKDLTGVRKDKEETSECDRNVSSNKKASVDKASIKSSPGVTSFFARQGEKGKNLSKTTNTNNKTVVDKENPIVKKDQPIDKSKTNGVNGNNRKRLTRDKVDDEEVLDGKKKRQRIQQVFSESSSEEEGGENEEGMDEDPIPPTPPQKKMRTASKNEEETISSRPTDEEVIVRQPGEKRKKRTRKLVTKTTLDEDGFMETVKVWEEHSTSASEAESEVPGKILPPAATKIEKVLLPVEKIHNQAAKGTSPKKLQPPAKKAGTGKQGGSKASAKDAKDASSKQTSMMTFFKKN